MSLIPLENFLETLSVSQKKEGLGDSFPDSSYTQTREEKGLTNQKFALHIDLIDWGVLFRLFEGDNAVKGTSV